jgi:6-phosphogluconate dehydrogenase
MEVGFIGLGRMGGNIVARLVEGGHVVVAYDRAPDTVKAIQSKGPVASAAGAGGNTFYKDDVHRAEALTLHGLHFVDAGTSGGIWGSRPSSRRSRPRRASFTWGRWERGITSRWSITASSTR